METLAVEAVQPGRKLARAVFDGEGKLLLPPGSILTQDRLEVLKECGIATVILFPLAETVPSSPASPPEDFLASIREMVAERFRLLDLADPYAQAIFDLAVERQGRLLLSHAGKISVGSKPAPAFQTQRPPKVPIRSVIEASNRMGTLPVVFHRLIEMINNPNTTAAELADLVVMDPALTAKLLRLVNSPFYGLAQKIETIPRAVAMVGTRQLITLAMGATLITAFKGVPVSLVNMQSFWSHSISCGAASRLLTRHASLPQPENSFVAGLLHDISRLLIYTQLPNHSLYILTEAKRRQISIHNLEKETLGFTHEELGGELLRAWNCPDILVRRVARHHKPVTEDSTAEDAILPAANMLVQALGYGSSGDILILPLEPVAWTKLSLSPEKLLDQCRSLDDNIRELRAMLSESA
jgi:HD-like signal output (HDOD) protein